MSLERTDIKYSSDFREKQIKVLQETIRNMQTQVLQTKMREQKDQKLIEQLERKLKEAGVKQLLLKTRIKETSAKLQKDNKDATTATSTDSSDTNQIIDIDAINEDDDEIKIIEDNLPQQPECKENDKRLNKELEENEAEETSSMQTAPAAVQAEAEIEQKAELELKTDKSAKMQPEHSEVSPQKLNNVPCMFIRLFSIFLFTPSSRQPLQLCSMPQKLKSLHSLPRF